MNPNLRILPEKTGKKIIRIEGLPEIEIDKNKAGIDNSNPSATIKSKFFWEILADVSLSISPDRKRIANVPAPTAKWNIATNTASLNAYKSEVKKKVPAKAATE